MKKKEKKVFPAEYLRQAGIKCFQKDEKTIIIVEEPNDELRESIREFLDKNGFEKVKIKFLYEDW